jgi:dihydrolipoamide dehydrogenase
MAEPASTSAAFLRRRGVITGKPKLDLAAMMKHKDETVAANVNGVGFLLKKHKIDAFFGLGTIAAADQTATFGQSGGMASVGGHSDI